jgi:hypothetical protein
MISLDEIENIIAPAEECDFSTLSLELKSKEVISLYFVDYPVQVKAVIEDLQRGKDVSELLEKAA